MNKKISKKTLFSLIAAVMMVIIACLGSHYYYNAIYMRDVSENQNLMEKTEPNVRLTGARNTYVVAAVKKVAPAIVGITTKVYRPDFFNRPVLVGEGVGSGVIFDKKGYIATNYHVIAGAKNNTVSVSLANGETLSGKVVGGDQATDLAVVKIDPPKNMAVAKFGSSSDLQVGEPAIAIGNPLGLEFQGTVTKGIISALHRTVDNNGQRFPLIQTDAAINPGNSGGALLNANGDVIGINSAKIMKEGVEGLGFSIPIDQAKPILKSLVEHGKVIRPYLGVWAVDKTTAKKYGKDFEPEGLIVLKVAHDGPAYLAKINPGDIITKINNVDVKNMVHFKQILDSYHPGDDVTIQYVRDKKVFDVTLKVIAQPTN